MTDESKTRMNLTAIKKVDPYAIGIVDSSSHVAFYTFNSDKNEWEKTDVEGAFFIYSRDTEPRHSIFINNRLNTMSFVEPITSKLELQSQPPFLLYRNERSRIRGFWFYNSEECERISKFVADLVQAKLHIETNENRQLLQLEQAQQSPPTAPPQQQQQATNLVSGNFMDIFKMLSKAQQDYKDAQRKTHTAPTDNNVLKFFAAAKLPAQQNEGQIFQRILPNTLSVEQLEKQQLNRTPTEIVSKTRKATKTTTAAVPTGGTEAEAVEVKAAVAEKQWSHCMLNMQELNASLSETNLIQNNTNNNNNISNNDNDDIDDLGTIQLSNFINAATANMKANKQQLSAASDLKKTLLQSISQDAPLILPTKITARTTVNKPALMLPTMFEKSNNDLNHVKTPPSCSSSHNNNNNNNTVLLKKKRIDQQQQQLNPTQLVQAFNYLLQNDEDFVLKLHEAYIKTVSKTLLQNYQ